MSPNPFAQSRAIKAPNDARTKPRRSSVFMSFLVVFKSLAVFGALACAAGETITSKAETQTKAGSGGLQFTTWNLVGLSATGTGKPNSAVCVYYRYDTQSASQSYTSDSRGNWKGNIVFTGEFTSKTSHSFQIVDCGTRTNGNFGTIPIQYAAQVPPPQTGFSATFTNYP